MKFRKKDKKNVMRVGAFISLLTAVVMVMIISIGKENSFFTPKVEIKALVENVKNLRPGSYVEFKGIKIGTVQAINILSQDEVEIKLSVLKDQLAWIKKDARVSIATAGLVGDKFLEVYNISKDSPAFDPETDYLSAEEGTDFKQILSKGESIATVTERILNRVDQIIANIDDGRRINETMNALNRSAKNFEVITEELKKAQLAQTFSNVNASMTRLDKTSQSVEKIMSRIEKGPGTMNSLIFDDGLHEDLRALLGGASRNKVIKYFIRESIKNSETKQSDPND